MSAGASLGAEMAARINVSALQTPCYVTDLGALAENLGLMERIQR